MLQDLNFLWVPAATFRPSYATRVVSPRGDYERRPDNGSRMAAVEGDFCSTRSRDSFMVPPLQPHYIANVVLGPCTTARRPPST